MPFVAGQRAELVLHLSRGTRQPTGHILAGHESVDSGKDRQVSCGASGGWVSTGGFNGRGDLPASGFRSRSRNRVDRRKASGN